MRVARPVELDKQKRSVLEQLARGRSLPARLVERARIVLRAAAGMQDQQIAAELGITPEKAARWRTAIWMAESKVSKRMHHARAGRLRLPATARPK